jgi:hypothetical protein
MGQAARLALDIVKGLSPITMEVFGKREPSRAVS